MATITLTFTSGINTSTQVGDTAYYCPTTSIAGFDTAGNSDIVQLGIIRNIYYDNGYIIEVTAVSEATPVPPDNSFVLFSKDNAVNMSSPLGYYSLVQFKNNSLVKSEMFSAACEVFESSK